jgi:superfamily II DNA/RNA helicase
VEVTEYVHRIGRTARGEGATGTALTLLSRWWLEDTRHFDEAKGLAEVLARSGQSVPPDLLPFRAAAGPWARQKGHENLPVEEASE